MSTGRRVLLQSLKRQRRLLAASIVLTPVDSLSLSLADRDQTAFLHGLYLTDKVRTRDAQIATGIQFARREGVARDIASIHRLLAQALGAAEGSLRLLSGLHAHTATFMSVATAGQSVLLLSEEGGGHFSTRAILSRLGLRIYDFPLDHQRMCIDRTATLNLLRDARPDFLFVDRSEGLRYEDLSFLGAVSGPIKIFDASQYLAPILTGQYANPFTWGFDLLLFSLHKSFPGPQKAGVVAREQGELWDRLVSGLSTLVSSSHAENSYLVGLTLNQMERLHQYTHRMLSSSRELELQLTQRGLPVVSRERQGDPGWPATHHVWLLAESQREAFSFFERLGQVRVHTNYRKLPYRLGYGLRLGTTFSAMAGIEETDMEAIADVIRSAAFGEGLLIPLRHRVRDIAQAARQRALVPPEYWS